MLGARDGCPQCRMSILRNGNIACPLFSTMSHVEYKERVGLCPMSL